MYSPAVGKIGHISIYFSFFHSWHSDPGAVSSATISNLMVLGSTSRWEQWSLETPELDKSCLHLGAVPDIVLMQSDGRTLRTCMFLWKPNSNSDDTTLSILFWFQKVAPSEALDNPAGWTVFFVAASKRRVFCFLLTVKHGQLMKIVPNLIYWADSLATRRNKKADLLNAL